MFFVCQVRSIECKRQSVKEVNEGQSATFAVRSLNRRVALRRATFRKVRHAGGLGGWGRGLVVGVCGEVGGGVGDGGWWAVGVGLRVRVGLLVEVGAELGGLVGGGGGGVGGTCGVGGSGGRGGGRIGGRGE